MIRTILVAATGDPTDAATLAAALAVARPFGAHLDVLHVRADPINAGVALATGAGSGALTAGLIEQLEADVAARENRAKDNFEQFCRSAGLAVTETPAGASDAPSAEWRVETGQEPNWLAAYGRTRDLIVASRSPDGVSGRATLEAVLIETGRPLFIPGDAAGGATAMPAAIERVAIAWKPAAQVDRAVALAMPLIERASEVVIASVEERPDERDEIDHLARYLGWHGKTPAIRRMPAGPDGAAATLLAALAGHADLVVMGGYGHSRLRQWIFGGFTQHVLAGAALPVLLAH
jgi:nucleotide-binding universal stress UspA family protein